MCWGAIPDKQEGHLKEIITWDQMLKWLKSWNGKVPPSHLPDEGLCYRRNTTKRKATHRLEDVITLCVYRICVNGVTFNFKRKAPWTDEPLTWYYFIKDAAGNVSSAVEWRAPMLKSLECCHQIEHLRPEEFPPQWGEWGVLRLRQAPTIFQVEIYDGHADHLVAAGSMLKFLQC